MEHYPCVTPHGRFSRDPRIGIDTIFGIAPPWHCPPGRSSGTVAIRRRARAGFLIWSLFIGGIPGRAALHDTFRDSAPLGDLAVVGAHPVDWNRGEAALLAIARETEPARAEFGGNTPPRPDCGASVPHHPLLDQENRVLNGGAALHPAALNRGGVDHPYLPEPPSRVEEGAVTGVLGGLRLHGNPGESTV